MVIERRQDWGAPGRLAPGSPSASDDAAIAALVSAGVTELRPLGGDLARTLGVSPQSLARDVQMRLPVDVIRVRLDDFTETLAVAHVLVGRSASRPNVAVMNAAFVDERNLAPRAHPGDGKLDVVHFELSFVDWIKAQRRMPTGSHTPHPGIDTSRVATLVVDYDRPVQVRIDAQPSMPARRIECELWADAVVLGV